jgi:hypothetical protein
VRPEVVDQLETFISEEGLWSQERLQAMVERLEAEADAVCHRLAADLSAVLRRSRSRPVPTSLVADIEGVLYPRLWKLMEAVWDGLPEAELYTRLQGLDRRLAPLLVDPRHS